MRGGVHIARRRTGHLHLGMYTAHPTTLGRVASWLTSRVASEARASFQRTLSQAQPPPPASSPPRCRAAAGTGTVSAGTRRPPRRGSSTGRRGWSTRQQRTGGVAEVRDRHVDGELRGRGRGPRDLHEQREGAHRRHRDRALDHDDEQRERVARARPPGRGQAEDARRRAVEVPAATPSVRRRPRRSQT